MKDFLHSRPKITSPGRVVDGRPSSAASADATAAAQAMAAFGLGPIHALPGAKHDVSVEAIKEGDRVTKLIVTCRCGERIEILCAYGPNPR